MYVNILNTYLANKVDVPASSNTEDRISVRYPIVMLLHRLLHS
jgi:hypothetical protein